MRSQEILKLRKLKTHFFLRIGHSWSMLQNVWEKRWTVTSIKRFRAKRISFKCDIRVNLSVRKSVNRGKKFICPVRIVYDYNNAFRFDRNCQHCRAVFGSFTKNVRNAFENNEQSYLLPFHSTKPRRFLI